MWLELTRIPRFGGAWEPVMSRYLKLFSSNYGFLIRCDWVAISTHSPLLRLRELFRQARAIYFAT
jgi:hypothetical protein